VRKEIWKKATRIQKQMGLIRESKEEESKEDLKNQAEKPVEKPV
jgi:hypothetical protein